MIKKTAAFLVLGSTLFAQTPDPQFSGFVDTFYSYDFNAPKTQSRQEFLYNHNRHNEFNLNLALLKVGVNERKYRANIALQAGTYAEDNYPENYEFLNEANAGVSLNAENSLWLDVGIFTSHLGFESAISMDNYTLTRSLAAESSPYYLTGAKLSYKASPELEMAFVLCNGWQTIEKTDSNTKPAIGTQLLYRPNATTTLNWSTFAGEADEMQRRLRLFNNLYGEFILGPRWSLIAGLDTGALERTKGSSSYDSWYIPSLLARYRINKEHALGMRSEFIKDEAGVVIAGNGFGAESFGASLNYDYLPQENIALRFETRWLKDAKDAYKELRNETLFCTASLALKF